MPAEKLNDQGFTPEESAMMTEGDDDLGEANEPALTPEPEADEPAPGETPVAKPVNGKAPDGYVPQSALHEARQQAKEYRARIERMEQLFQKSLETRQQPAPAQPAKAEAEIPAYDQDPLGHTKAQLDRALATINELKTGQEKQFKHYDEESRTRSQLENYGRHISAFKRTAPDYDDAFQFLNETRDKELTFLHEDATERTNRIQYEEGWIAASAMKQGKNPAQVFYEMAKARGYKGKQPQVEENKIDRLAAGQKAAKTNAGGRAVDSEEITLEKLAAMDPDSPEFDKAWGKYEKAERRSSR